ncbi:DUF1194 domain-containing protein [Mesorhizobium sp. KR2-14]|uniref:DUF1194 domain-containing protein n=1 Tax=Mesorhizobium sp. KR2-14 TaxID=3156610 RepID=UPI0032B49CC8
MAALLSTQVAAAEEAVDTAIIFAVDQSASIDRDIARLQLSGHVEALRSPEVARAIASGPIGCIAISYIEWSSAGRLETVLPWTRVCSAADAASAADLIQKQGNDGLEQRGRGRTSISYAIDVAGLLLGSYPGQAARKVIDISTNGTNNDGLPVSESRAMALELGHIVNGIAVSLTEPGVTDDLPGYLEHNVIAGAGSFVVAPSRPEDYAMAIRRKLVLEISDGREPAGVLHASCELPRTIR